MGRSLTRWRVAVGVALMAVGTGVFARGFFPPKVLLPGRSTDAGAGAWGLTADEPPPGALYDRVALVLVDAMGWSLVYPDGVDAGVTGHMPFLKGVVEGEGGGSGSGSGSSSCDGNGSGNGRGGGSGNGSENGNGNGNGNWNGNGRGKGAVVLRVEANAPTVTMPCLKALTSGSLPAFNDANGNLGAGSFAEADSVISQMGRDGKVMVYHGDETWGRMFPGGLFAARSDGTTAFFVTDTVEVDANVTRHVEDEVGCGAGMERWQLLVLHFLGLDHVGHVEGARGPMMGGKLREMDEVVKRTVQGVAACAGEEGMGRTLVAVLSDHGMTSQGNHGGTSADERGTIFAAIPIMHQEEEDSDVESESEEEEWVLPTIRELLARAEEDDGVARLGHDKGDANQVDLAASLSLVLGYPPPKNNVGVLLPELLPVEGKHQWRGLDAVRTLYANAKQVTELAGASAREGQVAEAEGMLRLGAERLKMATRACRVADGGDSGGCIELLHASAKALRMSALLAQRWMLENSAQYDHASLATGVALLFIAAASLGWEVMPKLLHEEERRSGDLVVTAACIAQALTLGSSDFVEEEHLVLFFMCYCVVLLATRQMLLVGDRKTSPWPSLRALWWTGVGVRALRAFHAMGDKFKDAPSMTTWLAGEGAAWQPWIQAMGHVLILVVGHRLLLGAFSGNATNRMTQFATWLALQSLAACIAGYKLGLFGLNLVGDVHLARISFLLAGVCLAMTLWRARNLGGFKGLEAAGTCLVVIHAHVQLLIQRAANAPVVAMLLLICYGAHKFLESDAVRGRFGAPALALSLRLLGLAAFHGMGNSNSLATVDISGSFTGLTEYSYVACGSLTFLATFGGPLMVQWLSLSAVGATAQRPSSSAANEALHPAWSTLAAMWMPVLSIHALALSYYSVVCVHLRHHLFVWSVFAPKLLYLVMTTVELGVSVAMHVALTAFVVGRGTGRKQKQA